MESVHVTKSAFNFSFVEKVVTLINGCHMSENACRCFMQNARFDKFHLISPKRTDLGQLIPVYLSLLCSFIHQ
jgi:hypothetical protein